MRTITEIKSLDIWNTETMEGNTISIIQYGDRKYSVRTRYNTDLDGSYDDEDESYFNTLKDAEGCLKMMLSTPTIIPQV